MPGQRSNRMRNREGSPIVERDAWSGQGHEGAVMDGRRWALALLAGAALAITSGSGVAHAIPDPTPPIIPSIIDQLVTSGPALDVDQSDRGAPGTYSDDVGMVCQNLGIRCR